MTDADTILAEIRKLNAKVDAIGTAAPVAVKRREAARLMGVSLPKLEKLIAKGAVKTTEDVHLVPMAEVRRYCAPKSPRKRKPSVGYRRSKHVEGQGEEAIAEMKRALRAGR